MVQRAIQNYYTFFDETLQSSTFIVLIITILICVVGVIVPSANAQNNYMKGSILESQVAVQEQNIVMIDGVQYELKLIKLK